MWLPSGSTSCCAAVAAAGCLRNQSLGVGLGQCRGFPFKSRKFQIGDRQAFRSGRKDRAIRSRTSRRPRALRDKLATVMAREYAEKWQADYERTKITQDETAEEFKAVYQKACDDLVVLFARMKTADAECSRVNAASPSGEARRGLDRPGRGPRPHGDDTSRASGSKSRAAQIDDAWCGGTEGRQISRRQFRTSQPMRVAVIAHVKNTPPVCGHVLRVRH